MKLQFLTSALLISSAAADFNGDVAKASSAASELKRRVDGWNSRSGLIAALGIQGYFPTLSSAVVAVSNDVNSISDSQVDPATIQSFGASVSGLLTSLTDKAQDFKAVGAGQIVTNDLKQLGSPAVGIVDGIVKAVSNDCDKIHSLEDALNSVSSGFAKANSAYGIDQLQFAEPPKC